MLLLPPNRSERRSLASYTDSPNMDEHFTGAVLLFSESPTRFLLEVPPQHYAALADLVGDLPMGRLGEVGPGHVPSAGGSPALMILGLDGSTVIEAPIARLKDEWQKPLRW